MISATKGIVSGVKADIHTLTNNVSKLMEAVFLFMQSPEEQELSAFVTANLGSPEIVLQDDVLLQKVISLQMKQKTSKDDHAGNRDQSNTTVSTIFKLHHEVEKDVDQVIAENMYFDRKFEVMRMHLDEMQATVKHEGDRVIDAVLAGPHDRIIDWVSIFRFSFMSGF